MTEKNKIYVPETHSLLFVKYYKFIRNEISRFSWMYENLQIDMEDLISEMMLKLSYNTPKFITPPYIKKFIEWNIKDIVYKLNGPVKSTYEKVRKGRSIIMADFEDWKKENGEY